LFHLGLLLLQELHNKSGRPGSLDASRLVTNFPERFGNRGLGAERRDYDRPQAWLPTSQGVARAEPPPLQPQSILA
jgi:hypothetical protein